MLGPICMIIINNSTTLLFCYAFIHMQYAYHFYVVFILLKTISMLYIIFKGD